LGRNCREFSSGRRKVKIQMRVSPNGKPVSLKKPAKSRQTGAAGSRTEYPPSTNVSSPPQAASRSRAAPRAQAATLRHGYVEEFDDNFVVDDDDSEEAFETPRVNQKSQHRSERHIQYGGDDSEDDVGAVREAGRPQHRKKRDIGPTITMDRKVASLNPVHQNVLEGFLIEAKKESEKIKMFRGIRAEPFSTTILREMAINFPRDESEMLEIPGIDPEKVQHYGKQFLKIIKNSQLLYESMMRQQEDRVQDPNHMNVINISDDEEYENHDLDDLDDNDSQHERSTYFPSHDVEAFNAKVSHLQSLQAPRQQSQSRDDKDKRVNKYKGSGRGGFHTGGFKKNYRKSSNGLKKTGAPSGGTRKRSSGGKSSGGNARSGGGGGIGMMPM
ncbi:MAG: hypothetical protein Q9166_000028, partial [cf. Caloplaca sp. 2 TL-2023]